MILGIFSEENNPYFHAATEEYLLSNFEDEFFFIYINRPSIIIGKHQNTLNEINYNYVKKNNIDVVRRLSGGGTVYHDLGNINFCFIRNGMEGKMIDFERFVKPIAAIVETLGLNVEIGKRNDLRIDGYKISGNAEHVRRNRVLHHGTLLIDSELTHLNDAIKPKTNYKDKAVQSVRSSVKNVSTLVGKHIGTYNFAQTVFKEILNNFENSKSYFLTENDLQKINLLQIEKYQTWEWNYGYSPYYLFKNEWVDNIWGTINIELEVEKGTIIRATLIGENVPKIYQNKFNKISGIFHKEENLSSAFDVLELNQLTKRIAMFF